MIALNERPTATCTVNTLGRWRFEVAVTGQLKWRDHTRTYVLGALDEDAAAQQGLRRFEDEIMALARSREQGA